MHQLGEKYLGITFSQKWNTVPCKCLWYELWLKRIQLKGQEDIYKKIICNSVERISIQEATKSSLQRSSFLHSSDARKKVQKKFKDNDSTCTNVHIFQARWLWLKKSRLCKMKPISTNDCVWPYLGTFILIWIAFL